MTLGSLTMVSVSLHHSLLRLNRPKLESWLLFQMSPKYVVPEGLHGCLTDWLLLWRNNGTFQCFEEQKHWRILPIDAKMVPNQASSQRKNKPKGILCTEAQCGVYTLIILRKNGQKRQKRTKTCFTVLLEKVTFCLNLSEWKKIKMLCSY